MIWGGGGGSRGPKYRRRRGVGVVFGLEEERHRAASRRAERGARRWRRWTGRGRWGRRGGGGGGGGLLGSATSFASEGEREAVVRREVMEGLLSRQKKVEIGGRVSEGKIRLHSGSSFRH